MRGRFAPSPTGPLHVGNLRTALVAWLSSMAQGGEMIVRVEDLDQVTSSRAHERQQLADLESLGLTWPGPVVRQSARFDLHRRAIAVLADRGVLYRCYCSRREIREAASAPHGELLPDGAYPGTCRQLTDTDRTRLESEGRRYALRLRTDGQIVAFDDQLAGAVSGVVDDVVLVRNDGVPAYNLAVVVDDHLQGVTEVVRGDDLMSSTPRQVHLQRLLGYDTPAYAHVPLVVGPDGVRLAKRHGAVTMADLALAGIDAPQLLSILGASLNLCAPGESVTPEQLVDRFSFDLVPRTPWTFSVDALAELGHLPR